MSYDGPDRRNKSTDHDTLITMVQILQNHVDNDTKNWSKFDSHVLEDKKNFDFLNKSIWMVFGGVAVLEIFIKLVK